MTPATLADTFARAAHAGSSLCRGPWEALTRREQERWVSQAETLLARTPTLAQEGPRRGMASLAPRQLEIARLVPSGASNAAIAAALGVAELTVKSSLPLILAKTGAVNRTQLAAIVARWDEQGKAA